MKRHLLKLTFLLIAMQCSVSQAQMKQIFQGADPEITNFDGTYRIYITNIGGQIRCMRPNNNSNLKGTWYSTVALTLPSWFAHGWAPAVVKVGSEYRMYLSGRDTRQADQQQPGQKGIHLFVSSNPNSGFTYVGRVVRDGAGGCTDVIDATIDGNRIFYGGSFGGGCFAADLTNNGRSSANHIKPANLNQPSAEFSEGAFVGNIPNVGKVMLYARGKWYQDTYGTNWAKWENNNWVPKGRVKFPNVGSLKRLGHASTKNGWIAVNSNLGSGERKVAIGQVKLVSGSLQGARVMPGYENETLEVSLEDVEEIDVNADFEELEKEKIAIFPNPTQDLMHVGFHAPEGIQSAEVIVYDFMGKAVKQQKVKFLEGGTQSIEVDIRNLRAGKYTVRMQYDGAVSDYVKHLVIQK